MRPQYKRILLKLSGEGLSGADHTGLNADVIRKLATDIYQVTQLGVQVCLVIGGGNFFRGARNAMSFVKRSEADYIGMLATVMNAVILKSALHNIGCEAEVFSGIAMPQVCRTYNFTEALNTLQKKVIIFAAGTGNPYFTTDTGAVLRALEMNCEIMMKATQVDGVYSDDPRHNPEAERYDKIDYNEIIAKQLNVMDMSAVAMARDNHLPVMIFNQGEDNAILKAVYGQIKCTIIQ